MGKKEKGTAKAWTQFTSASFNLRTTLPRISLDHQDLAAGGKERCGSASKGGARGYSSAML